MGHACIATPRERLRFGKRRRTAPTHEGRGQSRKASEPERATHVAFGHLATPAKPRNHRRASTDGFALPSARQARARRGPRCGGAWPRLARDPRQATASLCPYACCAAAARRGSGGKQRGRGRQRAGGFADARAAPNPIVETQFFLGVDVRRVVRTPRQAGHDAWNAVMGSRRRSGRNGDETRLSGEHGASSSGGCLKSSSGMNPETSVRATLSRQEQQRT